MWIVGYVVSVTASRAFYLAQRGSRYMCVIFLFLAKPFVDWNTHYLISPWSTSSYSPWHFPISIDELSAFLHVLVFVCFIVAILRKPLSPMEKWDQDRLDLDEKLSEKEVSLG